MVNELVRDEGMDTWMMTERIHDAHMFQVWM